MLPVVLMSVNKGGFTPSGGGQSHVVERTVNGEGDGFPIALGQHQQFQLVVVSGVVRSCPNRIHKFTKPVPVEVTHGSRNGTDSLAVGTGRYEF